MKKVVVKREVSRNGCKMRDHKRAPREGCTKVGYESERTASLSYFCLKELHR